MAELEKINDSQKNLSTPIEDLLNQTINEQKNKSPELEKKKKTEHKKLKHVTMSTVLTIAFVAVVVLVNIVATALFERFPMTVDMTKNSVYSISDESKDYVKKIDTDVLITVFAKEDDFINLTSYTRQADEIIKTYCKYNNHITYRYVDIDSNPDIMKNYENIIQYDIIVETNPTKDIQRTRKIQLTDLVEFDEAKLYEDMANAYGTTVDQVMEMVTLDQMIEQYGNPLTALGYLGGYVKASNADQAFMSAFLAVTDPDPVVVTMLTGRNEITQLSYLQTLLEANGYTVNSIDIATEDIPEDTDVAVIPAPKKDYMTDELKKLDDFLDNDGKMGKQILYIASVQQEETPNIDSFLKDYGIEVGEGMICETYENNYYGKPSIALVTDIADNFRQDVSTADPKLLIYASRPVNVLFEEKGESKVGTEELVKSTENAYVINNETDGDVIAKGQQNFVAVSTRASFKDNAEVLNSHIIVLGSEYMLDNTTLMYSQYQNREYILSLLNGITNKTTSGIVIEPKVIEGNIYDITDAQKSTLKWTFTVIIPVIVLVIGIGVWLRRKNR